MEEEKKISDNGQEFYTDAVKYWDKIPATVDGMLGGFGFISHTDIEGSTIFLTSLFKVDDSLYRYNIDMYNNVALSDEKSAAT